MKPQLAVRSSRGVDVFHLYGECFSCCEKSLLPTRHSQTRSRIGYGSHVVVPILDWDAPSPSGRTMKELDQSAFQILRLHHMATQNMASKPPVVWILSLKQPQPPYTNSFIGTKRTTYQHVVYCCWTCIICSTTHRGRPPGKYSSTTPQQPLWYPYTIC